ncbi:hypothetical protein L2E82_31796 [Cichorium intybus]|uniref:Uncharacterized protein n=1 Tax=Cichorium intybus TaxID=13427 RepID=A0ACB9BE76_CICIN|nr:hypothetical protein L2E82_31796 [Cichorium intybus]
MVDWSFIRISHGVSCGKNMAKSGIFLDLYIFNPPFFLAPLEKVKDQNIKHGIQIAGSLLTAGLAVAAKIKNVNQQRNNIHEDLFLALAGWVPCLFVNSGGSYLFKV